MVQKAIVCYICSKQYKQEKRFLVHLNTDHEISDYESKYVDLYLDGIVPTCQCSSECSEPIKWAGWKKGYLSKYVRGHNARIDSCFADKTVQAKMIAKRAQGYKDGKYKVWNDGLTKNTDERVFKSAKKTSETYTKKAEAGEILDWRIKDPVKAKASAKKISETKKRLYAEGVLTSWNKGLVKSSDPKVLAMSKKISDRYVHIEAGRRMKISELVQRTSRLHGFELITSPEVYRGKYTTKLEFKCLNCNVSSFKTLGTIETTPVCHNCNPKESKGQLDLYEFIKSFENNVTLSDRTLIKPKEVDILIGKKLAIEYDGLFWHSERFLNYDYAMKKTDICNTAGVQLIHIFEDEWKNKRHIVESMLKYKLGLSATKIGARECNIKQIKLKERRAFFDNNHIDGDVRAKYAFGLFHKDKLMAAISLRSAFHKKYDKFYEVARFAVKKDCTVVGGLSRLTKCAFKISTNDGKVGLISYIDLRYGNGKGYKAAGYKIVAKTKPRFWWTDFTNRYDRFKFRATNGISEKDVAAANGVVKIYGCPNLVVEYT